MQEFMGPVGVLVVRDWVVFVALIWISTLLCGQELAIAADHSLLAAAAQATAVASPFDLPFDVQNHKRREQGYAGYVEHHYAHPREEAKAPQCFQLRMAT